MKPRKHRLAVGDLRRAASSIGGADVSSGASLELADEVTRALAQLVRDRWVAEGRTSLERGGTLQLIVTRHGQ